MSDQELSERLQRLCDHYRGGRRPARWLMLVLEAAWITGVAGLLWLVLAWL